MGIGMRELLIILLVVLLVFGAKKLREQLEDEVNLADMKKWEQTPPARPAHDPAESTSTATATPQGEPTAANAATSHTEPTPRAEPASNPDATTSAASEMPRAAA